MNTTTKLWWLCYKAIPLVFDNSLSYLEMLARLLEYVNNLKDALKELYETVENLDEKVERYYNDLLSRLDELETTLRNYIDSELQNCKEELLEVIEENNTEMNQKIQDFIDYINGLIGEVKDVCFNPTNGHFENVCNILQDIYTHMQIDAMTVGEFDSTNYITVGYFDDFGLTAQEFDLRSKLLLTDFWKNVVDDKLNEIGDLENLKTISKNTLVDAINEVDDLAKEIETVTIGDLSNLTTSAKNNIVSAINEVDDLAKEIETVTIGDLSNLTTSAKNNIVSAINEVQDATVNQTESINTLNTKMNTVETDVTSMNGNLPFFTETNKLTTPSYFTFTSDLETDTFSVSTSRLFYQKLENNNVLLNGYIQCSINIQSNNWELEINALEVDLPDCHEINKMPIGVYYWIDGGLDVIGSCPIGYKIVNKHIILCNISNTYLKGSTRGSIIIPPIVINNYPDL